MSLAGQVNLLAVRVRQQFNTIKGQIDGKQPLDADLTTIAGLTATTDNILQSVSGSWASRTPAQVKTALQLPCDFIWVAQTGTRVVGAGDLVAGMYVGRAFSITKMVLQFDTADASGSTTVELRRNGSQVSGSSVSVSAANQGDGTGTDSVRTVTFGTPAAFSVGDRLIPYCTAVGTTPGKGLRVYFFGSWT